MSKVLIAAPIGDGKEYSINEWFSWIAENDYKDFDVCLCVNGRSNDNIRKKYSLLKMVEIIKDDRHVPINLLMLPYNNYHTTKQRLFYSREMIRHFALRKGYEYIFWLDTDTIPSRLDAINKLMEKDKSVISGLYFYKGTRQPVVIDELTQTNISYEKIEKLMSEDDLCKVWGFGFGCLLIHRSAFERVSFDYTYKREDWTEDFQYCECLQNENIDRWFYPTVCCKHYHSKDFIIGEHGSQQELKLDRKDTDKTTTAGSP